MLAYITRRILISIVVLFLATILVFLLVACIGYATLWSSFHEAYHGISETWVTKFRYYDIWRKHHLLHHQHPKRNFGTVFIYTDMLFGTKV